MEWWDRGRDDMNGKNSWIWIVLVTAVVGVLYAKNVGRKPVTAGASAASETPAAVEATGTPGVTAPAAQAKAIPRLLDLGATTCIPCKMMAPILEDLKQTYAGKLDVQFIDVWENPEAGKRYGINLIPTQIFYDAEGTERFRHEGFFSKEDILATWKELGVDFSL